jgi:2-oxoglutarate ferredoxin oxidoreductase subunit alpha
VVERRKPEVPPEEYLPYGALPGELVPRMPAFGDGYRMPVVGLGHNERGNPTANYEVYKGMVEHLVGKIEGNEEQLRDVEEVDIDDAEVVVVAYGSVGRSAKRAVAQARSEGLKVGCARLRTLWPFPDSYFRELAGRVESLLVAEMSMGKLVREVERASAGCAEVYLISKPGIELHTPAEIHDAIRKVIA